jgi:cytochrome c553
LAGQQPAYLEAQLVAFRDHSRGDPSAMAYMWGMASQLNDQTIKQLASYYAAQSPAPGVPGDQTLMAKGKAIYEQGLPDEGVPACISCHGAAAEGKANIPRLGGQYQAYLVKQLAYFKSEQRGNAPVMHAVTYKMNLEQMEAVTVYVTSR